MQLAATMLLLSAIVLSPTVRFFLACLAGMLGLVSTIRAKSRTRVMALIVLLLALTMATEAYWQHAMALERNRQWDQLPTRPDRPIDEAMHEPTRSN